MAHPLFTRFSLSTSTCSSLSFFPSTSCTPSCTLSSTTRSSWKACATPPTRRVRTPTTSPLHSHEDQECSHFFFITADWLLLTFFSLCFIFELLCHVSILLQANLNPIIEQPLLCASDVWHFVIKSGLFCFVLMYTSTGNLCSCFFVWGVS